jgi:hypothetical protein
MRYENASYIDAAKTAVRAKKRGRVVHIPCDPGNMDYVELMASGTKVTGYTAPAPTKDDVIEEAKRRIEARYPREEREDALMQAVVLLASGQQLPAGLKAAIAWVRAVRQAAKKLIARKPIPADYVEDSYWP